MRTTRARSLILLGVTVFTAIGMILAFTAHPDTTVRAQNSYFDTLRACRDGYIWYSEATLDPGVSERVEIISASPPAVIGLVLQATGPGTFEGTFQGLFSTPQEPGTGVSVTATVLRGGGTLTLNAVVQDCYGAGSEYYNPGDDRVDPYPTERVVVYCDQVFRGIDVWGIRPNSEGFPLASFDFDELTLAGPGGMRVAVKDYGFVTASLDVQGNFYVAWQGGPYGATGLYEFSKRFRCPFEFTQIATLVPTRTPLRLPVVTLTPSPTPTVTPTRARF